MITVEKNVVNPNEIPNGFVYLFIGPPKTGKTTECAKWRDNSLIIDTNLGSDLVNCNRITVTSLNVPKREKKDKEGKILVENGLPIMEIVPPEERGFVNRTGTDKGKPMSVYSLAEVLVWVKTTLTTGKFPYEAIVLDTIGDINDWIEEVITEEMGIKSMGDGQWGSDWGRARAKNLDIVKRFGVLCRKYAIDLVLVGHSKPTVVVGQIAQLAVDLPRGLTTALNGKADVIGYISIDKNSGKSVVSFQAYDERQVGSRFEALGGKTIPFSWTSIKNEVEKYKEIKR